MNLPASGLSAIISPCGQYRYLLSRPSGQPDPRKSTVLFLMLNPSTADASVDDPTIRRCRGLSKAWNCNGFTVANLYALRSTRPETLWSHPDPVGPDNDRWLRNLAIEYRDVVCAWGALGKPERVRVVAEILSDAGARLWCLGTTKTGAPKHPLYIRADQPLIPWEMT